MLDSIVAMLPDIIVAVVIVLCVGGASLYIYKAKKSGKKCIGCPDSSSCGQKGRCSGCSGACESCKSGSNTKK
jgi:hypothetical protein